MGSIAKRGLQQYLLQLQQHPLRTKAITAGVLSAISDIVAQKITGIQKLQIKRLILKVWYCDLQSELVRQVFGFAYLGPFGHFLHILLDKIFKGKKDTKTVAKKVVLEQVTSSPWNNLLFMLYYGLVIEGRPWVQVKSNIAREYPKVQYTAWTGDIFEPACEDNGNQEGLSVPEKSTLGYHSPICEEEDGEKKEHFGRHVKFPRNGAPSQATHARSGDEQEEDRPESGRKAVTAGEALVKGDENHQVVTHAQGKHAHSTLFPAHMTGRPRAGQVPEH
nr:peroxisomal membrane protein PMP22-like [Ipomoea batatas]